MVKKKTFYVCTGFQGKHCKHHGITCYQFYIRWCATYSDAVINQKVPRLFFIGWVCWWKRFECKVPTNERGKRQDLKRVCKPLLKSKARPLLPRQSVKINPNLLTLKFLTSCWLLICALRLAVTIKLLTLHWWWRSTCLTPGIDFSSCSLNTQSGPTIVLYFVFDL